MGTGSSKSSVVPKSYTKIDDDSLTSTNVAKHASTPSTEDDNPIENGEHINKNEQNGNHNEADQPTLEVGPSKSSTRNEHPPTRGQTDKTSYSKEGSDTNVQQCNNESQNGNNNSKYEGEPAEWSVRSIHPPSAEQSVKTSNDSELIENSETNNRTEETAKIDSESNDTIQENTSNESNEGNSQNGISANVDHSDSTGENKVSKKTNETEDNDQLPINGVVKLSSVSQRKVDANADAKSNAEQRKTNSGKQSETNSGKQSETNSGKQSETNSCKQHGTKSGKPSPEKKYSESGLNDNLKFYEGKISSRPFPGYKLVEMLKWKGDFSKLESNHSYIQWLFPIPEGSGMNSSAQPLQDHEAEAIRNDTRLHNKVLMAFKMMLEFYGMKLHNEKTGKLERSMEWNTRYAHLNKSTHNYLRITRILKSLGELGWEHLQIPWLEFLMDEAEDEHALPRLSNSSSMEYWIHAIKDESKQAELFERFYKMKTGLTQAVPSKNKKDDGKTEKQKETKSSSSQQSTKSNNVHSSGDYKSSINPVDAEKNLSF